MPQSSSLRHTSGLNRAPSRTARPFSGLVTGVLAALARRRDRALLARLDSHLLRDIGIDAEAVATECAKPFWQP